MVSLIDATGKVRPRPSWTDMNERTAIARMRFGVKVLDSISGGIRRFMFTKARGLELGYEYPKEYTYYGHRNPFEQ